MQKRIYSVNAGVYRLPNLYGYVEDTEVYFENEKIYLIVENTGKLVFKNEDGEQLAQTVVKPDTKNGKFDDAFCKVTDGEIYLYLPIVDYEDNYPNCDGEYDRWTVVHIGYICLKFNPSDSSLIQSESKTIE